MTTTNNKYYDKALRLIENGKKQIYGAFPFEPALTYILWAVRFKHITRSQYGELTDIIFELL